MNIEVERIQLTISVSSKGDPNEAIKKAHEVRNKIAEMSTCIYCDFNKYVDKRIYFRIGLKYTDSYSMQASIRNCKNIIKNVMGVE